jgi:hypothetical protein
MGFISKPLAYSSAMRGSKREHAKLIRLIKGGYVHVCEVDAVPPSGSIARRDSPYGTTCFTWGLAGARIEGEWFPGLVVMVARDPHLRTTSFGDGL